MTLYEPYPDSFTMDGVRYALRLDFDRVLRYLELIKQEGITAQEAADIGCKWLVTVPKSIQPEIGARLIERLFKEVIAPPKRRLAQKTKQRAFDFNIDAELIYASFMRDYGIDLIREQGQLHWCGFIALFNGLSEETPIKQVMRIRTMEMPKPNKHNAEQRQRLLELKTLYALPETEQGASDDAWNKLFDMLLAKAKG